jgi:hypothetical protein
MKRTGWLLILGALLTVAGIEIAFHWLLHRGEFPALLAIYLDRGNSGKAFNAGIVDNLAPAAFVGWISGWVGYPRWSPPTLAGVAVGLAVFIAALVPVYSILIGPEHFATVWGAPKSFGQEVSFHAYDVRKPRTYRNPKRSTISWPLFSSVQFQSEQVISTGFTLRPCRCASFTRVAGE